MRAARAEPERPEPGRRLAGGDPTARASATSSHVDTVLADAGDWTHDPWSGELRDGFLWGRGALDMKSPDCGRGGRAGGAGARGPPARRAASSSSSASRRGDGRRARRPVAVRGAPGGGALRLAPQRGRRLRHPLRRTSLFRVCCAEKGMFRFRVTARGAPATPRSRGWPTTRCSSSRRCSRPRRAPRRLRPTRRRGRYSGPGPGRGRPRGRASPRARGRAAARRPASSRRSGSRGPDAHPRLGEDQRHPRPRRAAGRLPRAARAWPARPRCARIREVLGDDDDYRGRVHGAGGRQPLAASPRR